MQVHLQFLQKVNIQCHSNKLSRRLQSSDFNREHVREFPQNLPWKCLCTQSDAFNRQLSKHLQFRADITLKVTQLLS